MYISNGETYDWIDPIFSVLDLSNTVQNPAKKVCIVEFDGFDIWSCDSDKDAIYDLERYYRHTYDVNINDLHCYFCKVKPFNSMPSRSILYYRFGKPYRKLKRNEVIKVGALHSFCGGELKPIQNPETIGMRPSQFSSEREFYNPTEKSRPTEF